MRIAVLSDIHGNLPALEAVLADLEEVRPEVVVVNGDLINRGPQNRAVVERLWELPYRFTLGNHDDLVVKWRAGHDSLRLLFDDPFFAATRWTAHTLPQPHLDWLAALPYQVHLEELGLRVTHGSPRHYREGYDERLSEQALGEILREYPARYLVGSHTHRPYVRRHDGALVWNTGAVGAPFNGDVRAQYLVLEAEAGALVPHFRQVPYDLEATLKAFRESGMLEEGGLSAEIFYYETQNARSMLVPFWLWAEAEKRPLDRDAWAAYRRANPERFAGSG